MNILKQSPPSHSTKTQIQDKFYPLTSDVAKTLREAHLTAAEWRFWSYLVEIDPFGDRYCALDSLAAMQECLMSKTTLWRAMCKFQELELFDFQDSGFQFKNETGVSILKQSFQKRNGHFKNEMDVSEMKQEFQICENQPLEPLVNLASILPQTIQTIQTFQTPQTDPLGDKRGGLLTEQETNSQGGNEEIKEAGGLKQEQEIEAEKGLKTSVSVEEKMPRAVVPSTTQIPQDLIDKLNELEIPLDGAVRKAIANHHISQAYSAARHVEDTWETINNPRSVFLYQLPKQPIETMPQQLSQEFLDWYQGAIAEGIVEDRPPNHLPKNQYNEPRVFLKDGRLMEWKRLRDEGFEPLATPEQMAAFFAKIRQQFGRGK